MPIKVPNNLPAIETLTRENVFVMTDTRAMTQDVRPLRILLLNLMPTKVDTETQLTRLLGNTPLQIELELLQTATHKAHVTAEEHMIAFYKTFDDIRNEYYDGMIITGAPIELMEFEEVDYWDELCEIMEWTKTHVHSTFHICWGAQAGLYYHYGIQKHVMPEKLSGVYKHHLDYKKGMLFRGFDDEFYVPHSRNTTVYREDIEKIPELKIICSSDEAGVFCVKSENDRQIFVTGHSEYDADTLLKEYMRDKNAGLEPRVPENYFPNDDDTKEPLVTWRSCANLLYSNWLNYFVYQATPYDIKLISKEDLAPVLQRDAELSVAKFGGTSLSDADQFRKVAKIIQDSDARRYIVASAPGRTVDLPKATDMLLDAADSKNNFKDDMDAVAGRFKSIVSELGTKTDIDGLIDAVKKEYAARYTVGVSGRAFLASRGEYLCAKVLADYIGYDFVDAADIILFDNDGKFRRDETRGLISAELRHHDRAVIPGFYGSCEDGSVMTFPRGGSDITGAFVAEAVRADVYENWTDVPGMLMADPRIVKDPLTVPVIIYKELRELALRGAEVLHEDAVAPVRRRGIPINILCTDDPDNMGTLIVQNADFYDTVLDISGISGKMGYAAILIEKDGLNEDQSVRSRIGKVFDEYGLVLSGEQIGIDSFSVVVESSAVRDCVDELSDALREATGADDVTISTGLATIAVVGRNIADRASVAVKIFEALSREHINIRFVDHGAERISVQVGVSESDYKKAVRAIYSEFTNIRV